MGKAFDEAVTAVMGDLDFEEKVLCLRVPLGGDSLQTIGAFWHVLLKAQGAMRRGLTFHSVDGLCRYVFRTMQHPWLLAGFPSLTKRERRSQRLRPPSPILADEVLYRSDGASRNGSDNIGRDGSCAAVRWENGVLSGRHAEQLGDVTVNVAEYSGLRAALLDAAARLPTAVVFQTDSFLVYKQVAGIWQCRDAGLIPYYTDCMQLVASLRRAGCRCRLEHIYREFNAEADGLANYILGSGGGILRVNWRG